MEQYWFERDWNSNTKTWNAFLTCQKFELEIYVQFNINLECFKRWQGRWLREMKLWSMIKICAVIRTFSWVWRDANSLKKICAPSYRISSEFGETQTPHQQEKSVPSYRLSPEFGEMQTLYRKICAVIQTFSWVWRIANTTSVRKICAVIQTFYWVWRDANLLIISPEFGEMQIT